MEGSQQSPRWFVRTAVAVTIALCASIGRAQTAADQLWLLSTRHLPRHQAPSSPVSFDYWVFAPGGGWAPAEEAALLAGDPPHVPTCVFIPGNRADWNATLEAGWRVFRHLKEQAPDRPFRLVIWSWPADRIFQHIRPDVQEKAARCDSQSFYLAQWLSRLDPEVPVCLIGYSFGARVVSGALHLSGGGALDGRALAQPVRRAAPIRAALVAAAMDYDWLLPGRRNGLAIGQVDQMLITVNLCDLPLKYYSKMYYRNGPPALGYAGLPGCGGWGEELARVERIDVSAEVGNAHQWACYLGAPSLACRLAWYAFLVEPVEPIRADAARLARRP